MAAASKWCRHERLVRQGLFPRAWGFLMARKKSTIKGIHLIAQLADVSIGTVDRALHGRSGINEVTRQKVLRVAAKIGYTPVNSADGPTANDAYFAATSTFLNAAGRKDCVFQPIKFDKPVYLILTLTIAASTFASGQVTAVCKGDAVGIK